MRHYIFSLILAMAAGGFGATHVFWYKAAVNDYNLHSDPGPALPDSIIIHESIIASGSVAQHSGLLTDGFAVGNGLDNAQGRCGFLWSSDLCNMAGIATSARFRGELRVTPWSSSSFYCNEGLIKIRCGVADFYGNLLGCNPDPCEVSETATWRDFLVTFGSAMGYDLLTTNLMAEEIINYTAPSAFSFAKKFAEIDVTEQVNWILSHTGPDKGNYSGQYAIVFLATPGDSGSTGKISLHADEACTGVLQSVADSTWTRDGNTIHLVVEGDLTPIPGIDAEYSSAKHTTTVSLSAWPNPFRSNISIQITGAERQARLELFGIDGKRIARWSLAGEGPRRVEYSPEQLLATGLYVLRLSSGSQTIEKRLLMIK